MIRTEEEIQRAIQIVTAVRDAAMELNSDITISDTSSILMALNWMLQLPGDDASHNDNEVLDFLLHISEGLLERKDSARRVH